jgi:hypothetical protein
MPTFEQDSRSWQVGYEAGLRGERPLTPDGVDGLAFQSGVIEGLAERQRTMLEREG